ncbi:hypothetical protein [Desulfoscipio geothermicus]|uniref:Uncharacterized protein n=1 Tax=Desulfoscipio geothermicus DSM 3669 TaxID=1121426 RepID=A0A1I6CZ91_9FIRM|nr:hypothetical protein [Desulfoscipio geothermicus]SFQ98383.1 hypothetical protein SAMN05660706_10391 [Desulfoscipio geothermicus DSM 3669]
MLNIKTISFLIFLAVGGALAFFYGMHIETRKKNRRQPSTDE